ncbi:MAG: hypothetical protein U0942_10515 [Parvibaculum sp.]|jgi:hypothetical protein|uniref:hypothetical protein n=1 Tax=Parvibaculum sp. TaxID=2024848 RepID=UPI000CA88378|nr:hypothetical protein [Parvibaculum sp.]MDZ4381761.1 hypothetical protein [Parvibaculum sp.]PKP78822.1 MAG: hypothetical protein CVT81_02155 [Alphaproteobacteria bacterium HGW-Alphaproteobacteria-3]
MKAILATGTVLFALTAASASMAATALDSAVGNTVSVSVDGKETRYYFNDNGSASLATSTGEADVGTWKENNGQLCVSWQSGGGEQCVALQGGDVGVGQKFSFTNAEGAQREAVILDGKVPF